MNKSKQVVKPEAPEAPKAPEAWSIAKSENINNCHHCGRVLVEDSEDTSLLVCPHPEPEE